MVKKLFTTAGIVIAGGATAFLGMPWWIVAVAGVLAGYFFPAPAGRSFGAGFAAGFLLWWGSALFFNSVNAGMLAGKMGALFEGLQTWQVLSATGILGGLLAGMGCLTGSLARNLAK